MASINDFKIVKAKSLKMFDFLEQEFKLNKNVDNDTKARLGFYHLVIEAISQNSNIKDASDAIIDQEYNKIIFGRDTDDLGVDAVCFLQNENDKEIALFNFKYHKKFSDKNQEENAISRSQKFIEYCLSEKTLNKKNIKVNQKITKIREMLAKDEICTLKLYMVSNDNLGHAMSSEEFIRILEDNYGMQIISISLDDVSEFVCGKPKDKTCSFVVKSSDFLKCDRNELSTDNSYVVKMSLIDVLRITGRDDYLANKYDVENDEKMKSAILDVSLLYDNVRGYLGETSYNQNIQKTLKNEPENFFMFNNGLTVVSSELNVVEQNARTKYRFILKGYQLVNGGQTIRSIYDYLKKTNDLDKIEKLRNAQILMRIFKVSDEGLNESNLLKSHIAEYTNSQNAIKANDLKSVDYRQIQIENYLKQKNILYVRKAGDVGEEKTFYEKRVPMELLAKIIYSFNGHPERVTAQKKRLFIDYYDDIFGENLDLEVLPSLIDLYYMIKDIDASFSDQKACYVIYVMKENDSTYNKEQIRSAIQLIDSAVKSYQPKTKTSDARKMVQKAFKEHLDALLKKKSKLD